MITDKKKEWMHIYIMIDRGHLNPTDAKNLIATVHLRLERNYKHVWLNVEPKQTIGHFGYLHWKESAKSF